MPILNYTTKIPVNRTVAEIQQLLAKAGAASVQVNYIGGEPVSISFLLVLGGNPVPFRLPVNWEGVYQVLFKDPNVPARLATDGHAKQVAWRVVKDWVEAQMALIQSGQASMTQLFLPHAVRRDGRTFYEEVAATPAILITATGEDENP